MHSESNGDVLHGGIFQGYNNAWSVQSDSLRRPYWILTPGSATAVVAATAPELEGRGGLYVEDCQVAAINDAPDALAGVKSYAVDPTNAQRLWEVSEQLVGQRFALA